jgi:hypothetical protein
MGITCSSNQYTYKGVTFEIHAFCGPCPLDENGDPEGGGRLLEDNPFWEVWESFEKEVDKEQFKVYAGGCKQF